ncbi:MAG TPA: RES family NAD+ phosphorylase [Frankiaceae bacterium]|nr:RES family NAD+ phosphorylase [Frankiaceae bacterium]
MARYYRCAWFDPDAQSADVPGHPLYVYPRQGAGRIDDPDHEYRVLYLGTDAAGCVAEVFGDFAVWTPALLDPPPSLPGAFRAVMAYEIEATLCDLDEPKRLAEFALRPSQVVSNDRRATQQWARDIYETGAYDGVSWWSRRDPRWTSCGLWGYADATVEQVTVLVDLAAQPVVEAADVLLRQVTA